MKLNVNLFTNLLEILSKYNYLFIFQCYEKKIIIQEPLSFQANVLNNQIWYRSDPSELESALVTEVEAMRLARSAEVAEMEEIMAELKPLIGEVA